MAHNEFAIGALVADILGHELETTVADRTFQIDPRKLPNNAILDLLRYGTQRRFNDATGGSDKTPEAKHAKVEEMIANYQSGVIRAQRGGGGASDLQKEMRKVMLQLVKAKLPAEQYKQEFTDAEASVKNAKLDKLIEANEAMVKPIAEKEMARKAAERKAQAEVASGITIEL